MSKWIFVAQHGSACGCWIYFCVQLCTQVSFPAFANLIIRTYIEIPHIPLVKTITVNHWGRGCIDSADLATIPSQWCVTPRQCLVHYGHNYNSNCSYLQPWRSVRDMVSNSNSPHCVASLHNLLVRKWTGMYRLALSTVCLAGATETVITLNTFWNSCSNVFVRFELWQTALVNRRNQRIGTNNNR